MLFDWIEKHKRVVRSALRLDERQFSLHTWKLMVAKTVIICGLLLSVKPLYLIGVCFGEDQRTNTIKDTCSKILEYAFQKR
jgi:hypothetical protein